MDPIPFFRPSIGQAEIDEVVDTLKSGWLTTGQKTKAFEAEFGRYLNHKHAIAVNSCTAALHLALEAVGVQAGDTVVVPTMTFAATAEVVRYFNAHPLLVDCRAEDMNLDVADAERRIRAAQAGGARVVAIIPVHYGGQIGDIFGVQRLARQFDLKIIEDAAHCGPAYFRESAGKPWLPVGSLGDITCYSFYANKTMTTGEGGMACCERDDYADRMRIMSLHGISKDAWKRFSSDGSWYYEIIAPGYKYNLTDIASSIGLHQVRKADAMHRLRTQKAELYSQLLSGCAEIITPQASPDRIHSWHLYPIRLRLENLSIDRAKVITELKQRRIASSVHWLPLHMHPYYREKYSYAPGDLPVAAGIYPQLISLPLYPDLTDKDITFVCESLKEILANGVR